jgi:outer membrane protein OmpA-like peptidoglycan-associated protein
MSWLHGTVVMVGLGLFSHVIAGDDAPPRPDLLTLAHGAVPLKVEGNGRGIGMEQALRFIDGDSGSFTAVNRADDDTVVELIYELPAATRFDRFAVPNVLETPSPSQTFFRQIDVFGSNQTADAGYVRLAGIELATHTGKGQLTELPLEVSQTVRWVKIRLQGGIEMLRPNMFLEFTELVGNGSQQVGDPEAAFSGTWRGRGVRLELQQDGAAVAGCYDRDGELAGTVTGSVLHATGASAKSGIKTVFVLGVTADGAIRGVSSTNGAPFHLYEGQPARPGSLEVCQQPQPPTIGCGSVVHGIRFDFDSAVLRPESVAILGQLYEGLRRAEASRITIEGHTSSEGAESYNQELSEQRAAAVRQDLIRRGLAADRVEAVGIGEVRPIASNRDENGRSLNRRVEIHCLD